MYPESDIQFLSHPVEAYVCPSRRWSVVVVVVRGRPSVVVHGWLG